MRRNGFPWARSTILLATGCVAGISAGQPPNATPPTAPAKRNPTFSVEAAAVNDIALVGAPVSEVTVAPGDILTVEVYLRDWSPGGEKLRAYQASFDAVSYTSGAAGTIKPVGYEETTVKLNPNDKNAFILDNHPRYVFAYTANRMPIVDSVTPGYRYLNVLPMPKESRPAPQDGTKFYCGTVLMKVSEDAAGTFKLKLLEDPSDSMLRDDTDQTNPILPLDFEPLKVQVVPGSGAIRVVASDPPANAIDARMRSGSVGGKWDRVTLTFSNDASTLKSEDFEVSDGTKNPPRVRRVAGKKGSTVTAELDRPLSAGRWTRITHKPSRTGVTLGYLPGDVNNDGVADGNDIFTLVEKAKGDVSLPIYQLDVDGDGQILPTKDAVAVIDAVASMRRPALAPQK